MNRRQFVISGVVAGSYLALDVNRLHWLTPPPRARLGLAIIGLGDSGLQRLEECLSNRLVDVMGLCDIDDKALDHSAGRLRSHSKFDSCQITRKASELFENSKIQAVSIAIPRHARADLIEQACNNGKHVLVEAPWADSISASERIMRIAARPGKIVQQAAFDPDWDDQLFEAYLQAAQRNVVEARINVETGPLESLEPGDLLHHNFDLLGACVRWLGGATANVTSVIGGFDRKDSSSAIRVELDGNHSKHILMTVNSTDRLKSGQFHGQIESRGADGGVGRFVVRSENMKEVSAGNRPTAVDRFMSLVHEQCKHPSPSASATHELNRILLMAGDLIKTNLSNANESGPAFRYLT